MTKDMNDKSWPALPYEAFQSTAHLLHMALQVIGKCKLYTPFEPQWSNVALWLTSSGLTTGLIPYKQGSFSIEVDLINHEITCANIWGKHSKLQIKSMSVAELTKQLLNTLHNIGVEVTINLKPQEIENPIPFDQDKTECLYDASLANNWWHILISSYQVMQRYHARFTGRSPAIGLMWGTFDLRDARYTNKHVPTTGINAAYIRRNAMDVAQVETGFWSGNPMYPKAAYFSFIYPEPKGIASAKIKPAAAKWNNSLMQFVLDYDDVRQTKEPEKALSDFLESTYQVEAELAGWNEEFVGRGVPV